MKNPNPPLKQFERRPAPFVFKKSSLTKSYFADECDINRIMASWSVTGLAPQTTKPPVYSDFSDIPDYQSALNAVIEAKQSFMQLPSAIRERFGNNPAAYVDFCSNPDNLDELVKLGLAAPRSEKGGEGVVTPSESPKKGAKSASMPSESPSQEGA